MGWHVHRKHGDQAGVTLLELLVAISIFAMVGTMLVVSWISLQNTSVYVVRSDEAQAEARDALSRMSTEVRDAQPPVMPTPTASPSASTTWMALTVARPMEVAFYSAYNIAHASDDGTGTAALRLTRIYLDTSGSSPQKTLLWERDMDNDGVFDRSIVLARNVVNASIPNTGVTPNTSYTALFTYGYRDADGNYLTTDNSDSSLDLTKVISVQIRLITDVDINNGPKYMDLTTTVRPRNADAE